MKLHRRQKRGLLKGVTCGYCHFFYKASKYFEFRKCPAAVRLIKSGSTACDGFKLPVPPSDVFWCLTCEQQINLRVCIARQKKKHPGCVRCKQGKVVEKLNEKYNPKEKQHG